MYISVTRLQLKSVWKIFQFHKFNGGVQRQVKTAKGIISINTKGTSFTNFYTLTSWESKEDMLAFMRNGAHAIAMKNSSKFAVKITTKGYESTFTPAWEEVIPLLA
jgi:heme-degrading monooxygenase HmoA